MKIRLSFVSNSSSASFLIPLSILSAEQYHQLINYSENNYEKDSWIINLIESDISIDKFVKGFTIMDNGDMGEFLENIGISSLYIQDN